MMDRKIEELSEELRKEIFHALVDAQDQDLGVERSRQLIGEKYELTIEQVRQIEKEGLRAEWPPL